MSAQPTSVAVGSRRGVRLPPIQTTNRHSTVRVKPPLPEELDGTSATRVPLRPKSQGFALRRWFTKAKPNQPSNSSKKPPTSTAVEPPNASPSRVSPSPADSATVTPISVKSPVQLSHTNGQNAPNAEEAGAISTWDPPPLFMVYPQAVKYATLPFPALSTEEILRRKVRRDLKSGNEKNEKATGADVKSNDNNSQGVSKGKGWKKGKKSHSRNQSSLSSSMKWTEKIFVLVTSGYLLQYNVDGNFDRLPEEVLALGEGSVAFACDAIPGRHWVLQISQTPEDIEPTAEPKKTLLGRFRRNNPEPQKPTSSFLLVLDSAEELASWLMYVRREIQCLGGKGYSPSTPGFQRLQQPQMTHLTHSGHRNSLLDQSLQTSSARHSQVSVVGPDPTKQKSLKPANLPAELQPSPSSLATAPELDNLKRESRLSYVSIGTRTMPSSQSSTSSIANKSPPPSRSPCVESPRNGCSPNRVTNTDLGNRGRAFARLNNNSEDEETPSIPPRAETRVTSPPPNFSHPILNKRNSITSSPKPPFTPNGGASQKDIYNSPKLDEGLNFNHSPSPRRMRSTNSGLFRSERTNGNFRTDSPQALEQGNNTLPSLLPSSIPESPLTADYPHQVRRYASSDSIRHATRPVSEYRPALSILEDDPLDIPHYLSGFQSRSNSHDVRQRPRSLGPRALHDPTVKPMRSIRQPSPNPEPSKDSLRRQRSMTSRTLNDKRASMNSLSSRKSMSHIPHGPPPAPPPTCPLPDVPPIILSEPSTTYDNPRLSVISCQSLPHRDVQLNHQ